MVKNLILLIIKVLKYKLLTLSVYFKPNDYLLFSVSIEKRKSKIVLDSICYFKKESLPEMNYEKMQNSWWKNGIKYNSLTFGAFK